MFGGPGHHKPAFRKATRRAEEREVDRLRARASEQNLCAVGTQRLGGRITRMVEHGSSGASLDVRARWIAVRDIAKGFANLREHRRRSGVVEIDAAYRPALRTISRGCGPAGG